MYLVKVKDAYRWDTARVAGREFSKAGMMVPDEALVEEILFSPVLEVRQMEIDATEAARRLADAVGIDLAGIKGSGVHGRVVKADVVAAIKEGEDAG